MTANILKKKFYTDDLKLHIRFKNWNPDRPTSFSFKYFVEGYADSLTVSCNSSAQISVYKNARVIDGAAQITSQGIRVLVDGPIFMPGRLSVYRTYAQIDDRFGDGSFTYTVPELTMIQITESTNTVGSSEIEEDAECWIGETGKSAYEYALDGGYTGSEADFILLQVAATNAAPKKDYTTGKPFKTGDKFFDKTATIAKDVWCQTIVCRGTLTRNSDNLASFIKPYNIPMSSILNVTGFFRSSISTAIFPIGMNFANNTNLFCDSNGTTFYVNIIFPTSSIGFQCEAAVNVFYTI